jgi:hypothetical protein
MDPENAPTGHLRGETSQRSGGTMTSGWISLARSKPARLANYASLFWAANRHRPE